MTIGANKQKDSQGVSRLTFLPHVCLIIQDRMEFMLETGE